MLRQRLVRLYEHVKHVPKFQASWPLLKALWPKKFQALNVQSLKFFHVIFPVVLWLHSHPSFFHYLIATVGHLLPCNTCQVCCDWREIAHTMRDRVFEDHEEQLIDIHDVKVLFFILKTIIILLRSCCGHSPWSIYTLA